MKIRPHYPLDGLLVIEENEKKRDKVSNQIFQRKMNTDEQIIQAITEGNLDEAWNLSIHYFSVEVLEFLAETCRFELLYKYYQLAIDRDSNHQLSEDDSFDLSCFLANIIHEGKVDVIDYLFFQKGMDPNLSLGEWRITPLMEACCSGQRVIVERLLSRDADVEQTDHFGQNAFFYAVLSSDVNIFYLLLFRTGRIDYVDHGGSNLLHRICQSVTESSEVFDSILNLNVLNINATTELKKNTPLHLLLQREINPGIEYQILKLLDHPEIDLTVKKWDGSTAWDVCKQKAEIPESIQQAFRKKLGLKAS